MVYSTSLLTSRCINRQSEAMHLIPELAQFGCMGSKDMPEEGLFGDDGTRSIHLTLTGEEARLLLLALYSSPEPESNELIQRIADVYNSSLHIDRNRVSGR